MTKNKRKLLIIFSVIILCIIIVFSVCFYKIILYPFDVESAELSLSAYDEYSLKSDKAFLSAHARDEEYVCYYNTHYDFSFDSPDNYCEAVITVKLTNNSPMAMHVKYLTLGSDNETFVFASKPEKAAVMIPPGETDTVSFSFLCCRNSQTDEEMRKSIAAGDIRLVNNNKLFGDLKPKLSLEKYV